MPGNPLGLQRDDLVFEQGADPRTAALLANVSGTDLHLVEVAGDFGRELSAQGEAAMIDFAREWLASLFGSDVKSAIKRSHATRWNHEPWVLGAMSAATPGDADARRVLMRAGRRPHLVRRRGGARDQMGHGRRRLGIGRARGGSGAAPDGHAEGAEARTSPRGAARTRAQRRRRSGAGNE